MQNLRQKIQVLRSTSVKKKKKKGCRALEVVMYVNRGM